ncbi:hypothetical protein MPH_06931, partial [Macrophomina phaseolina MS6]
ACWRHNHQLRHLHALSTILCRGKPTYHCYHHPRRCMLPHDKLSDKSRGTGCMLVPVRRQGLHTSLLLQLLHRHHWHWSPDQRDRAACSWRRSFVRWIGYRRCNVHHI